MNIFKGIEYMKIIVEPTSFALHGGLERKTFRSINECALYFDRSESEIKSIIDNGNLIKGYYLDYKLEA